VTANLGLDGDGKTVSVFLNQGDGTFAARRDYETGLLPGSVAIADLNGDARPDLATTHVNGVSVLLNAGDGTFTARRDYETGESPGSVAIADLNGDGKLDLAVPDEETDTLSVLLTAAMPVSRLDATTAPASSPCLSRSQT
jgi:hypothetical protein